jgi:phosphoglycerate-specific signal transduction histidine kinase
VDDALSLIIKEGNCASEVVGRIRALIKKAPARKDAVKLNDAIFEVISLTRMEVANNSVSVRTELAKALPCVQGDRGQLQQVILNLIINAVEALREVGEKERELLISTRSEPDGVSVEVRDSGRASRQRFSTVRSKLSTPRNQALWGSGYRSAGRLSKHITDDCGRPPTCHVALSLVSVRLLIQPPHREC